MQLSAILASAFNCCANDIFECSSFHGKEMWPSTDLIPESIGMKGAIIVKNSLDHFSDDIFKQDIKINKRSILIF